MSKYSGEKLCSGDEVRLGHYHVEDANSPPYPHRWQLSVNVMGMKVHTSDFNWQKLLWTTVKTACGKLFILCEWVVLQTRAELSLDGWDLDTMGESGTFLWCQFRRPVRCQLPMEKMQTAVLTDSEWKSHKSNKFHLAQFFLAIGIFLFVSLLNKENKQQAMMCQVANIKLVE